MRPIAAFVPCSAQPKRIQAIQTATVAILIQNTHLETKLYVDPSVHRGHMEHVPWLEFPQFYPAN